MSLPVFPLIFDGHNDLLTALHETGGEAGTFLTGRDGHIDRDKCRRGGFGGGLFALYVPSPIDVEALYREMRQPRYDVALPAPVERGAAQAVIFEQIAMLSRLEAMGGLHICRSTAEISACLKSDTIAAVMHMEGADAIDPDLHLLEVLYRAGLRSLGPVWSRPTIFGAGVPFRFPGDGDTGPGLTDPGRRLVRRCNELGILLDVSHLTEAGFWDLARHSTAPLVATHSNALALCRHARNLGDRQLDAIRDSDGLAGLNFAVAFLREDGRMADAGMDQVLRHLDYLLEKLGPDRVAFGSDFDGAKVPGEIGSAAGLPALRAAMEDHGIDGPLMQKLCHGNWLRVLGRAWNERADP